MKWSAWCALGAMLLLAGCGAGGFSGNSSGGSSSPAVPAGVDVTGVAAKGPFVEGTVRFFALKSNGEKGAQLKIEVGLTGAQDSVAIEAGGKYSGSVRGTGPVLAEVTGKYLDEATGTVMTIDESAPLRAATVLGKDKTTISITPLTELAVRHMQRLQQSALPGAVPPDLSSSVASANKLVSQYFKVNILSGIPIENNLEQFGNAATTQEQKDYSLVLSGISWLAQQQGLDAVLATFQDDLADGALTAENGALLLGGVQSFLASDKNRTGIPDVSKTNLTNLGGKEVAIRLRTAGALPAGTLVGAVTATVVLPPGVTVKIDPAENNEPLNDVATPSGVVPNGSSIASRFIPASGTAAAMLTLSLTHVSGFTLGEFVTILCELPPGKEFQVSDFAVYNPTPRVSAAGVPRNPEIYDASGGLPLAGVGIEIF